MRSGPRDSSRSTASRVRRLLVRATFGLLGLAVSVAAAECLVYLLDPFGAVTEARNGALYRSLIEYDLRSPRLFRIRPSQKLGLCGHEFRTDSRGLRGPELGPKPPGTRRCLFLGDSVVLGLGVAEESTFVHRVEIELTRRTGRPWEAINAGHLLHDTTQELGVLEEVGLAYEPDLVVLVYVDNDIVSSRAIADTSLKGGSPPTPEAQKAMERSRLLGKIRPWLPSLHAVLEYLLVRSLPVAQQGAAEQAQALGFSLEAGWETSRAALASMLELTRSRGIAFAVMDYHRGTELSKALLTFCEQAAIAHGCIAFTPEEWERGVTLSKVDAHANPLGHRILTEHILDELGRLRLVEGLEDER